MTRHKIAAHNNDIWFLTSFDEACDSGEKAFEKILNIMSKSRCCLHPPPKGKATDWCINSNLGIIRFGSAHSLPEYQT